MPELPEVETTLRGIQPFLEQQSLAAITVRERRLRWPIPARVDALVGARIVGLERRAKYILLHTDADGALLIHLGMSGSLRVVTEAEAPRAHDHFDLVTDGAIIRYNDPRRFGCLLWAPAPVNRHPLLATLGPEPLGPDFDGALLYARSRGRRQAVKNFLMDGKIVVGVGNIYASESLYMAGIHPNRPAGRISAQRYAGLARAVQDVLGRSIRQGGTTLRDYVNSDGNPGYFALDLMVYGREGKPCLQCSEPVRQRVIGQRSSFYCPRCQR